MAARQVIMSKHITERVGIIKKRQKKMADKVDSKLDM